MLKFQAEITDMLLFARNYWSSCRVMMVKKASNNEDAKNSYMRKNQYSEKLFFSYRTKESQFFFHMTLNNNLKHKLCKM